MTADIPDLQHRRAEDLPFRMMLEALPALVVYVDATETVRYANASCIRFFGQDIAGRNVRDIVGDELYVTELREHLAATRRGERPHYEITIADSSGTEAVLEAQHLPDFAADGTVRGYIAHAVHISKRKSVERELTVSRQRFEDFASTSSDWFWEMDTNNNLTFFTTNRGAFATVAGPAVLDEMLRLVQETGGISAGIGEQNPDDTADYRPLRDERLAGSNEDGSKRYFSINGKTFADSDGRYAGYRGSVSDITKRVLAEQATQDALALAQHANQAKSRFLAAAGHDLRQPLQAIRLLNGALRECVITDDVALKILEDSEQALRVMDSLLASLLDLTKLDSGVVVPELRHFRLSELFDGLRAEFARSADEKGLRLKFAGSSAVVVTDRMMLESILRNLLTNALRYTRHGKVLVGCRLRGEHVRIEVWDTGIGIPDNRLLDIFEAFYQIGNPDRDTSQGLGLGLSIVARLGELLQCGIEVRSEVGRGTVFSVNVPRGAAALAEAQGNASGPSLVSWDLSGTHVLILEDDPPTQQAMEQLLGMWQVEVISASGGKEAEKLLTDTQFRPDLIVSDYRLLGGETGIDAVDRIAPLLASETPVIFMTGDRVADVRDALGERFPHLLEKPVAPARLRALIRNVLRQLPERRHVANDHDS